MHTLFKKEAETQYHKGLLLQVTLKEHSLCLSSDKYGRVI